MSSIINALFGHHNKDKEDKKNHETVGTATTNTTASSSSGSSMAHTAVSDDVRVNSVVSTETNSKVSMQNSKKITDLMARLGSTHLQVDEYSRRRTEEISEAVSESIKKIVAETQLQQQQLLADANTRTSGIENDFKRKIQEHVAKLDAEKATVLSQLEKELNVRQEHILESARKRIDDLNEEANRLKMGVLKEAQAQSNAQVTKITEQVTALGQEDASRRLQSTTTTVITTKAASDTHVQGAPVTVGKTTQCESSKSTCNSSSAHFESR
jgi:DNA primase catalytic subunit